MKCTILLPLLSLFLIPTSATPIPVPADYGDYGSYPPPPGGYPAPEGGYGSYAGDGAAEGAAAVPAPPA